ncbi:MAG: uroporphyrinogen-III synthase [Boseongicola sp. SB0662_bin_57]|nr:uroporphyrinogen-III synthase [Boseongicola sp. SB0662_bin_57]
MDDPGPTLLLTRPEAQSASFLADCERRLGQRIPAVISPVMDIIPVAEPPDLNEFATIVAASGNAVRQLGDSLEGRIVLTVGEATAGLARGFGARAKALGETAESFLERIGEVAFPVIVCRGRHARCNLAERLSAQGANAVDVVLYDQAPRPLSRAAHALLAGSSPVLAPVFSPRSARLLSCHSATAPVMVLAISEAARAAWRGDAEFRVARHPTADSMCDLVVEAL